jgi:hypothetical protein
MGPVMANFRDTLDWSFLTIEIPRIVNACADVARNAGQPMFGIEFYGECIVSAEQDLTTHTPASGAACNLGVGDGDQVFIYEILV